MAEYTRPLQPLYCGLPALVPEAPEYLLFVLSEVENRCHENSRWMRFVEDAVWKSLHHLSANVFKVNWGNLRKDNNAGEIGVQHCHELRSKPWPIIFKPVENLLQIGVCSRGNSTGRLIQTQEYVP